MRRALDRLIAHSQLPRKLLRIECSSMKGLERPAVGGDRGLRIEPAPLGGKWDGD